MSAVKYSPYIPNIEAWVEFYKNQPKEYKAFYTIGKQNQNGEGMDPIKLVSPTKSVIDRAQLELKREHEREQPYETRKRHKPNRTIKPSTSRKKTYK